MINRAIKRRDYRREWRLASPTGDILSVFFLLLALALFLLVVDYSKVIRLIESAFAPASVMPDAPIEYQILLATASMLPFVFVLIFVGPFLWYKRRHILQAVMRRRVTRLVTTCDGIDVTWSSGRTESITRCEIDVLNALGVIYRRHRQAPIAFRPEYQSHWTTYVRAFNLDRRDNRNKRSGLWFLLRITAYFAAAPFLLSVVNRRLPPFDGPRFLPDGTVAGFGVLCTCIVAVLWLGVMMSVYIDRRRPRTQRRRRLRKLLPTQS